MDARSPRRHRFTAPRYIGLTLLALSVLMLATTVYLGAQLVRQSRDLQKNVEFTQAAVDANVRTLGQAQRELLRLEVLLAAQPTDRPAADLEMAFVDQRTQEGSLPYQVETLGSQALLMRSQSLARQWSTSVRPQVTAALVAADPAALGTARSRIDGLEKGYNQLVSDGEINRKVRAGEANDQTRQLMAHANSLLIGLSVTVGSFIVFMMLAGYAFWQFNRQREAGRQKLLALNAELRTHALVVHNTDNLVIITDASGAVEWVNEAFVQTTGYPLDVILGRRPGDVLQGPGTDQEAVARMRAAVLDGRPFSAEVLNYAASGRPYWVHIESHPVRDDSGTLTQFIAVETDVTDRRRIEENLRQATETALSLAQEKAGFLATMSHEIRTPLNAVLGVTQLLIDTPLNEEQAQYVQTARSSGSLLLALVNDILDFSALESGRMEIESRQFSVRDLLQDVKAMFAPDAGARGVELVVSVEPAVPAQVTGDENRIRQVLLNLVANGLKFTARGRVEIRVGSDELDGRTGLTFCVEDSGIGIPLDRQQRIFLPFTQVDPSTTRKYGGTGLGLSICRLIADRLGGSLTVHSRVGVGSTFSFTVPVSIPEISSELVRSPLAPVMQSERKLRVLLAEDDRVNRMVALRMLSRLGIVADVVEDGAQAVEAVSAGCYDLVLMDVHMPRMDGVAALAAIRALDPQPAVRPWIVAVTANALEGDRETLLAAGMDGYLSKPVVLGILADVLASVPEAEMSEPAPA